MQMTVAPLSIKLPRMVGVQNIEALMECCSDIRHSSGDVVIDCSEVAHFDPLGMTVLVAALESLGTKCNISMPWLSTSIASYLDRMDFFKRISVDDVVIPGNQRHDRTGSLLEITLLRDGASSEVVANNLATAVVGAIVGRSAKPIDFESTDTEFNQYYDPIRYALSELVENALTHARNAGCFDASVWIASQYYPQYGVVQISVVDDGCGFLATLCNHPEVKSKTHAASILAALKPRVSCNRDAGPFAVSVNEGVGLTTTVKIAKASGGQVHIVSGDSLYFDTGKEEIKRNERIRGLTRSWDGVVISATFDRKKLPSVRISDLLPNDDFNAADKSSGIALNFID